MKFKISTDALVLIGFLVVLGLASARIAATGGDASRELIPRRTVTSARPGGWKAFRMLIEKRGRATKLVRKPATKWDKSQKVIVSGPAFFSLSEKSNPWTTEEAVAAKDWARAGGTLLVFTDAEDELVKSLDFSRDSDEKPARATPCQPTALLAGVKVVSAPDASPLNSLSRRGVPILKTKDEPLAALMTVGSGKIVVVSSAGFVDNAHLGDADNARFAVQLLDGLTDRNAPVYFDEFRQGFEDGKSFWDIVGPSGQRLAWQIAGVLLLLAWSAGTRFGLVTPLPPNRRLSAEYIASLGDLYRRAGARDVALEVAVRRLRHDLAGRTGLSHDARDGDLIKRAAAALGGADPKGVAERLTVLFSDIQSALDAGKKEFSSRDLLALVQRIEMARKELGIDGI